MGHEFEVIYEDGVLKPDEPLPYANKQRLKITVNDPRGESADSPGHCYEELAWLDANGHLYKGQYAAVSGNRLISHGTDGKSVIADARLKGFGDALIHYVPENFGERKFELF